MHELTGFKQSALYRYSFSVRLLQATASLTLPSQAHRRPHHTTAVSAHTSPTDTRQTAHAPDAHTRTTDPTFHLTRPHARPHSLPPPSSPAANGSPRSRRASLPSHPLLELLPRACAHRSEWRSGDRCLSASLAGGGCA